MKFLTLGILLGQVAIASEKEDYSDDFEVDLGFPAVLIPHIQEDVTATIDTGSEKDSPESDNSAESKKINFGKYHGLWMDKKEDAMLARMKELRQEVVMLTQAELKDRLAAIRYQKRSHQVESCLDEEEIKPLLDHISEEHSSDADSSQDNWSIAVVVPEAISGNSEDIELHLLEGRFLRIDVSSESEHNSEDNSPDQLTENDFLSSSHFTSVYESEKVKISFDNRDSIIYGQLSQDSDDSFII